MVEHLTVAPDSTHERIVEAALELLESGGVEAASTRAICAAADVQPPTLYRIFGDKQRLLHAVVERGFDNYVAGKSVRRPSDDPIDDLKRGWDFHVDFALAHPTLYALMSTQHDPARTSPAAEAGWNILASLVHRIAKAGLLVIDEVRATQLVHAAGTGTALTLIALPSKQHDMFLSHRARDAIIATITQTTGERDESGPIPAAITLRAHLEDIGILTPNERQLMDDWLERIIGSESQ